MTPAIDLKALCASAGGREVLNVPELCVTGGEFVALLGPNGAGKSTLLRCLLGLQAARGRVGVLGHDVGRLRPGPLARLRRRMGYVPQLLPPPGEMPLTVREVVAIGRTGLRGLLRPLRREDWRLVDEWLDRLGLTALAGRGFGHISGGEQRKTLIARAMVQRPEVLLLDEPTANLDLGWRERLVGIVDELGRSPLTVVLVCHELEVIPPVCGRVILLDAGRVVADGACAEVLTGGRLSALYRAAVDVHHAGGRWALVPAGAQAEVAYA